MEPPQLETSMFIIMCRLPFLNVNVLIFLIMFFLESRQQKFNQPPERLPEVLTFWTGDGGKKKSQDAYAVCAAFKDDSWFQS